MPTVNVFDRTALFYKEKASEGRVRIRRIPWDLIAVAGSTGLFVSPLPVAINSLADITTDDTINENVADMLYDDNQSDMIDEVIDIMYFDSENAFNAFMEGCVGFYDGNESQSAEFGYPREYAV